MVEIEIENNFNLENLDGRAILTNILIKSTFGSLEQAIVSLSLFSHPNTVRQLEFKNVFRIVRTKSMADRGKQDSVQKVMWDDNKGPTDTFIWANGISRRKFKDIQFNHIWNNSNDIEK